jgi:hypothetical protein
MTWIRPPGTKATVRSSPKQQVAELPLPIGEQDVDRVQALPVRKSSSVLYGSQWVGEDQPALAEFVRQVFVKDKPTEVDLEYLVCDPAGSAQGNVLGLNRKSDRVERSVPDSFSNGVRLVVVDLYSFSFAEPRFLRANFQDKQQH